MTRVVVDGACWSNPRGFGRFTRELVSALARRSEGFQYTLVLEAAAPRWPVPAGIDVVEAGLGPTGEAVAAGGARGLPHLLRMGRAIAARQPELVFFPASYSWVPAPTRAPQVVTIHDAIPERFPRLIFPRRRNHLLWRAKGWLARATSTRVLTVSQAARDDLVSILGVPPERIDVTSEAADPVFAPRDVDRRAVLSRHGLDPALPAVLYVGGFNAHKNVLALVDAAAALETSVSLVLAGDTSGGGFYDNLPAIRERLARHPELERRVAFPGWLADDDLVDLYNAAVCLVLPSLAEGFGLPVAEAMACGCPVVCSDRTSLPEVAGGAALLVDPESPTEIGAALGRVLAEPDLRESLRDRGLTRAAALTWDAAAAGAEACFRRALA